MGKKAEVKTNNWVAKHAGQFNQSAVFKDRKQSQKRGYIKHKGRHYERPSFCTFISNGLAKLSYKLSDQTTPRTIFILTPPKLNWIQAPANGIIAH